VAILEKMTDDKTPLAGWKGGETLGSEAKAALAKIKQHHP
jgi:hypothetical protein